MGPYLVQTHRKYGPVFVMWLIMVPVLFVGFVVIPS